MPRVRFDTVKMLGLGLYLRSRDARIIYYL
jgi:hypothetical protein